MMRRCCRSWAIAGLTRPVKASPPAGLLPRGKRATLERVSRRRQTATLGGSCAWSRLERGIGALDAARDLRKTLGARNNSGGMPMTGFKRAVLRAGFAALVVIASQSARAQGDAAAHFPNRPIRLIVGFAAGGGNDLFARLVGQK